MKIAILGGSFDPPHLGHLLIAQQIKEHLNIDQVWLMPCFKHPFGKELTSATHRLAMTKLLESDGIQASDFEIKNQATSYTIDTLNALKQKFPNDTFFWIIGSDQLEDFKKWKNWREIIDNFHLIIFARNMQPKAAEALAKVTLNLSELPHTIHTLTSTSLLQTDASSTEVRLRVKQNSPIRNLVPKKVDEYIRENKLYL